MQFNLRRWEKTSPPHEEEILRIFRNEGLNPYLWSNAPGDTYSAHSHSYHKVIFTVQGSITWVLPDSNQEIVTLPGDRLDLPAGTVHAARVGDQGVSCLEAHIS